MSRMIRLLAGLCVAASLAGCGAADHDIDPGELELRDLLGIDPAVAMTWTTQERASARRRIEAGLAGPASPERVRIGLYSDADRAAVAGMAQLDERRSERRDPVIALASGELDDRELAVAPVDASGVSIAEPGAAAAPLRPVGWEIGADDGWSRLWAAGDSPALITTLAAIAGAPEGVAIDVAPAPRSPFVALYLPASRRLLVNPIVLASAEIRPEAAATGGGVVTASRSTRPVAPGSGAAAQAERPTPTGGNPYSFFGSVGECAASERLRCEECLAEANCLQESRDASDGAAECTTLGEGDGIGYFQFCVNLSLAIATVADCVAESSDCATVESAGNQLSALTSNQLFLEDATCQAVLDDCLAEIYGTPDDDFPGPPLPDAGPGPAPPPSRDIDVSCSEQDCDFSPQCTSSCDGPECGQVFSCNSDCGGTGASGGGGGGGCDCEGESGDSGGSGCDSGDTSTDGGSSGCDSGSDSSSGGSSGCDSGGDSSSGGSSGCGSGDSSGGSSGGDCGGSGSGGDCGGSDCGGSGDCGGGDCGGGGGSSCSVAQQRAQQRAEQARRRMWGSAISIGWAFAPLIVLGWRRRRKPTAPGATEAAE